MDVVPVLGLLALLILIVYAIRRFSSDRPQSVHARPEPQTGESLPPLRLEHPSYPATPPPPATQATNEFPDLYFEIRYYKWDRPASDAQHRLLFKLLGNDLSAQNIGMEQASVMITICYYMNGYFHSRGMGLPSSGTMGLAVAAAAKDADLTKHIREWGNQRFREGRSEPVPKLRKDSKLYKRVDVLLKEVAKGPRGYAGRHLAPPN